MSLFFISRIDITHVILTSNELNLVILRKKLQCDVDNQGPVWKKNTFNVSHILGVIMLFYNALFNTRGVQHGFHVTWCSCPLTVTRRVSLVGLKLLTLLEHVSSPGIKWSCIVKSLVFCVVFVDHCLSRCFGVLFCFGFIPNLAIAFSILFRSYHYLYLFIWPLYCMSFFDVIIVCTFSFSYCIVCPFSSLLLLFSF